MARTDALGLRDQEAGSIGAEVRNTNGTHDLGPLQINSWWMPRIARLIDRPEGHVRYWLRFDNCFNIEAARWIFLSALSDTNDYWQAMGMLVLRRGVRHYFVLTLHRWRRRQGRDMCEDFMNAGGVNSPQRVFARLRAMDPLAFDELLLECFERRDHQVIRNRRYTGDGGSTVGSS